MTLVSLVTALHYKVSWNFVKAARSEEDFGLVRLWNDSYFPVSVRIPQLIRANLNPPFVAIIRTLTHKTMSLEHISFKSAGFYTDRLLLSFSVTANSVFLPCCLGGLTLTSHNNRSVLLQDGDNIAMWVSAGEWPPISFLSVPTHWIVNTQLISNLDFFCNNRPLVRFHGKTRS